MVDASVEILLNGLEELQFEQPHRCLLKNSKDRVEKLQSYLPHFKTFLKDAPRQRREDEMLWQLIRSIRDAVYEAEDIIDAYVTQTANKPKRKNYPFKIFNRSPDPAKSLLKKIADIMDEGGWTKHIKSTEEGEGSRYLYSSMAEVSVEILRNSMKELQVEQPHLLKNTKDRVEKLQNYLPHFNTFLNDPPRQCREDEMLWKLIGSIRDAVYEAEDIIDAYTKNYRFRIIKRSAKSLLKKIADIYRDHKIHYIIAGIEKENGWTKHIKAPQVRETNVVGFEDEVQRVKGFLFEESQELEAISIVGIPGLGKTTVVGKIFLDRDIRNEFPSRIWVHVSQEFTEKDIFLAILKKFTTITNDLESRTEKELAKLVMSYLENRRFLLVMDEVWSSEDWDKLKIALPSTNKRGKVLITSRWAELGRHVNRRKAPHMLRFLTTEESVLLLQLEVFRDAKFARELEVEGRLIAEKCGGIALAIVVMGDILVNIAKECSLYRHIVNFEELKFRWKDVSDRFDTHFIYEDQEKLMDKIILLNYAKLPNHLRECFLYFGMFPKDFQIPSWQLICLWIAEGFIQEVDGVSLEETAEDYLDELINRSFVRDVTFHANGISRELLPKILEIMPGAWMKIFSAPPTVCSFFRTFVCRFF